MIYFQQKVSHPGRRADIGDPSQGPYGGLFQGLGEHGNNREVLNEERRKEYNDKLDQVTCIVFVSTIIVSLAQNHRVVSHLMRGQK